MSRAFELRGYDHIKVALQDLASHEKILECFGFQKIEESPEALEKPSSIWGSGDAFFALYEADHPLAKPHFQLHGDTVFDLCFHVESFKDHPMVFCGVGRMKHRLVQERTFKTVEAKAGIQFFDHNTLNVDRGNLESTVDYYIKIFGLEKGQYFDIHTKRTGLYSWVTRSPDRSVQIPFNEAADDKSQIQEYITTHRGPGVQHIAMNSKNLVATMDYVLKSASEAGVSFLNTPDTYYELVSPRVKIKESIDDLKQRKILVDQDKSGGYLLQIFSQNLFSAVFFELIQREGNEGFGEGNFQALFEAMELDQVRRGVLQA